MSRGRLALPLLLVCAMPAAAQENNDLDLIPEAARGEQSPPPDATASGGSQRIYLESASIVQSQRATLVPFPPPATPDWEERLFLDLRKDWHLAPGLSATYSGRFNLRAEDNLPIPTHENLRNDFREAYVSWTPAPQYFVDAGRFNLKSGVASGYNPTDFFKTRAVVEPLTADPQVLREDRLGTAMLHGEHIFEGGAVTAAFAPKLEDKSRIYNTLTLPSFRPMLDRTNAEDRLLLKANYQFAEDLSPELLYYRDGSASRWGANLTRSIGQQTIAYVEWAGGREASLTDRALAFGRATGTIPGVAPSPIPDNTRASFANTLSVGASYTTESKITFNLEYHYNESAFSPQDWRNWQRVGAANTGRATVTQALWFIRSYALDQQEPLSRNTAFLRADWNDAFIPHLELTGLISTDLHDGSSLAQLSVNYDLSSLWTVGALAAATLGTKRSDNGSLPQAASLLLKLARFF
jgi:hypothetical protein